VPENEQYELPPEELAKFAICERLLQLAPETSRIRTEQLPAGALIYGLFRRGARSFEAVLSLSRNGFGDQALMLARVLFEDMVDAHWVKHHPTDAVEKFNDAALLAKHYESERTAPYAEHPRGMLPEEPLRNRLTEEQQMRLDELLAGRQHFGSWIGKGLTKRVDDVRPDFGPHAPLLDLFSSLFPTVSVQRHRPQLIAPRRHRLLRWALRAPCCAGNPARRLVVPASGAQAEMDVSPLAVAHDEFMRVCGGAT
jgi:hypothetical protein